FEPARTDFLLHHLAVVPAGIRAPVGISHDGCALDGDDLGAKTFLVAADVSTPEHAVGSAAGIGGARHKDEIVVRPEPLGDIIGGLQIHRRIRVALFAQGASVEDLLGAIVRDVFFGAVEREYA